MPGRGPKASVTGRSWWQGCSAVASNKSTLSCANKHRPAVLFAEL